MAQDGEVVVIDADVWQGIRRSQRQVKRPSYPNEKDDDTDEVDDHVDVEVKVRLAGPTGVTGTPCSSRFACF